MPRDTILDRGAAKVILSKAFAAAMDIHAANLDHGVEFITAMGVTRKKVEFLLSCGTPREHHVSLHVIVVGIRVHDALFGMEFMVAMGRYHDTKSEVCMILLL